VNVCILESARRHLFEGYQFYEEQAPGLGRYFLRSLFADIESLETHAGVHAKFHGFHRRLSRRFPFAVYYIVERDGVNIYAILDCRSDPAKIRRRLRG
jgi:hypothetical protein